MSLFIDLRVGDTLDIDKGRVSITVEEKTGPRMRVKIDADRSIPVRKIEANTSRQVASIRGLSHGVRAVR